MLVGVLVMAMSAFAASPAASSSAAPSTAFRHESTTQVKDKSLVANGFYDFKGDKFVAGILEIKGTLGSSKVDVKIDAKDLTPFNKESCESTCAESDDNDAMKCSGVCSYGIPEYMTSDAASKTIFFYMTNGAGHNVPLSIYALSLPDSKPRAIGETNCAGLTNARYDGKTGLLWYKEAQHGVDAKGVKPVSLKYRR